MLSVTACSQPETVIAPITGGVDVEQVTLHSNGNKLFGDLHVLSTVAMTLDLVSW